MFSYSDFNKDISTWKVCKVEDMSCMFSSSPFNQDISTWDTSKVETMKCMFNRTEFSYDLSNWDLSNLKNSLNIFLLNRKYPFDKDKFKVTNYSYWYCN